MRFSILDIARQAGVSKSTVSRVINGGIVSEPTRHRVEKIMREMGYSPNYMARGLRGIKNPVVGLLSTGGILFTDPALSARFAGIVDTLQKHNHDLLLVHEENFGSRKNYTPRYLSYLQDKRIDGLITVAHIDLSRIKEAAGLFRNVVYAGERIEPGRGFRVYMGNYNYSCDAYSLFMENGHRRILTVSFGLAEREKLIFNRKAALQKASEEHRVPYNSAGFFDPLLYGDPASLDYLQPLYRMFTDGAYTALFVDDLFHAKAAVSFFAGRGLKPYNDFSIITTNHGNDEAAEKESFLTCIHLPSYKHGVSIASLIVEVIANEDLEYKDVIVPYRIIHRSSIKNLHD